MVQGLGIVRRQARGSRRIVKKGIGSTRRAIRGQAKSVRRLAKRTRRSTRRILTGRR